MKVNQHLASMEESYLFSRIGERVRDFEARNPEKKVIRLGIGDVTLPLPKTVVNAMRSAADDLGKKETFHGYGPEYGYEFLRSAVAGYYGSRGVRIAPQEIFIGDGAKSDLGNILDLFTNEASVLIPDPVYPAYVDANAMDGRPVRFLRADASNGFLPGPPTGISVDIIYLCSPNNPTGAVYDRKRLTEWVNYALGQGAVLLFDAAYEAFVQDKSLPRSIYEIDGARRCAIEFCSLSKTAGFTGVRCGYTVLPDEAELDGIRLQRLWKRRQATKFNGVSYVTQRAAEAVFSAEGLEEASGQIAYYLGNAKILADTLQKLGIWFTGGKNSPYLWMQCPGKLRSWEFFDFLLEKASIVGTPGAGFGQYGEGYFRLSAFGNRENMEEAAERLRKVLA